MARTKISEFSATAADNTDIDNIDIAEGCAPSGINNAIRELMAQLKEMQTGASGDTFTFASLVATTADINGGTVDGAAIGGASASTGAFTNLSYTGTLTGGTGVVNIGSGQVYKDASGNVGVGTTSPTQPLSIARGAGVAAYLDLAGGGRTLGTTSFTVGQANDGVVAFFQRENAAMYWATNATERMRLDSSGNLGLGVTPSAWQTASYRVIELPQGVSLSGQTDIPSMVLAANSYINSSYVWTYKTTAAATRYSQVVGQHQWYTAPSGTAGNAISFTQAMTLDASGNLLVGKTSTDDSVQGANINSNGGIELTNGNSGTQYPLSFYRAGSGSPVGFISTDASSTTYATSSDYRLKENVAPMTGALAKVQQLKPCTYTWKADGSAGQGFIAHELQAVVPDCVTGEKDAVDADGKPQYQGVDTSFLVATLTAAIQEQQALIQSLTARLEAMEAA